MPRDANQDAVLPLKQGVQEQIKKEQLSRVEMAGLMELQNRILEDNHDANKGGRKRYLKWVSSSAIAVVLMLGVLFIFQFSSVVSPRDIATEVVANHLKLKPLDIATHSMETVQGYFTQLDFSLIHHGSRGQQLNLSDNTLLGGRYCSVTGKPAAQLRYKQNGNIATFYQVDYDSKRYGEIPILEKNQAPLMLLVKGLEVSMWVEKDIFMILVSSPNM